MAVTLTQPLASGQVPLRRIATRRPATWSGSRARIAGVALMVALLGAMIPGLAHAPATGGSPQRLTPPVAAAPVVPTASATVIADPTPQPGP